MNRDDEWPPEVKIDEDAFESVDEAGGPIPRAFWGGAVAGALAVWAGDLLWKALT